MYKVTVVDMDTDTTLVDTVTPVLTFSFLCGDGAECAFIADEHRTISDVCKVAYAASNALREVYDDKPIVGFVVENMDSFGSVHSINVGAIRESLKNYRKNKEKGVNDSE